MTATLVRVNEQHATSREEIFSKSLLERFAKFAGVSESSKATYLKSLKQLFKYFQANAISTPTRDNLIEWVDAIKPARTNDQGKIVDCRVRLDADNVIRRDGDISDDGRVYRIHASTLFLSNGKSEEEISTGKTASTTALYLTAAKIFFRWTAQENIFPNIADHLKSGVKPSHNHKKDALETDQCKALVKNVKGDDLKSLRDRAVLSLMATAGLRTIEVVRADVGDVRFERGKFFLYVQGKGHDEADEKILLSKQTYKAISAYLKARGKVKAADPLFVSTSRSNRGQRLETQTISRMVKANLRAIGLDSPRLTAHSLRHAVATNLIFCGVELPQVQMVMRHTSLSTTMIYQHAYKRYQNNSEQILADMIFGKE